MSTERQVGMGPGPIPSSKIKDYLRDELDVTDVDHAERCFTLIRRMDDEYLSASNKAASKGAKGKNDPDPDKAIAADDVESVRGFFQRQAATNGKSKRKERVK